MEPFRYDQTEVYPADYAGLDIFLSDLVKSTTIQEKRKGNKGRKQRSYKDLICAFDIETSLIKKLKQSVMYVWQLQIGIDITIIGRTWEEFRHILNVLASGLKEKEWICIFVHNLSYEFCWLKGIYPFEAAEVFATQPRKILKCDMYEHFEFRCSYRHSNMNLAQYTSKMQVQHVKLSGEDFNYSKTRYPWSRLSKKELSYCINDVLGLVEAIQTEMEFDGDNIASFPLTSTGYIRRMVKKSMSNFNHYTLKSMLPSLPVLQELEDGFRGGDTHTNRWYSSQIVKNVTSRDRSSSYPEVQCNHLFPMSRFIKLDKSKQNTDGLLELIEKGYAVIFRATFYNLRMHDKYFPDPYLTLDKAVAYEKDGVYRGKKAIYGHYSVDNGRILEAEQISYALTDVDFRIIAEIYDFDMDASEIYFARYGELPEEFTCNIKELYRNKTELKDVAGQEIFYTKRKNMLNSVYGMSAQHVLRLEYEYLPNDPEVKAASVFTGYKLKKTDPEEQMSKAYRGAFSSYAWGVWTTAWARYELYEGMKIVYNAGAKLIYWDTDSLKYIDNGKVSFEEYNNNKIYVSSIHHATAKDPAGNMHSMGVFEEETKSFAIEFIAMGAKKYAYRTKDGKLHITIAGVNKKKGAEELEKMGGLAAMHDGTKFRDAGGIDVIYNDLETPIKTKIQNHDIEIISNMVMLDGVYTLGRSGDYKDLLKYLAIDYVDAD